MAVKKNEIYPLRMEGYGSSGEGVARLDGQAVFVKGALEGELCSVQLLKVGKSAAWGKVNEILEPSPHRQAPDCPQYPKCGGCQLRHMTYAEETEMKRRRVQDALQRIGGPGGGHPRGQGTRPLPEQDPVPRGRGSPGGLFPGPQPRRH